LVPTFVKLTVLQSTSLTPALSMTAVASALSYMQPASATNCVFFLPGLKLTSIHIRVKSANQWVCYRPCTLQKYYLTHDTICLEILTIFL
jgi:hypothetical protein